ncbi:MAG: DUF192 domain-containing protein [Rhodospirillaceae bacterium]
MAVATPEATLAQSALAIETAELEIVTEDGRRHPFVVEIARTNAQRSQGLMHRPALAGDAGMLFLWEGDGEHERVFWMKNTLIPLDLLFLDSRGFITKIHSNAIPHDETPIRSDGPVAAVLEVNGSTANLLAIDVGDRVVHPAFAP